MQLGIEGRRALVTACGRGIGRAVAKALAAEGVKVAVCSRTPAEVENLVAEMGGAAAGHTGRVIDLEPVGAPEALLASLHNDFGAPEIVVHNLGGTLDVRDPLCSLDDWDRVMRINFGVAVELNRLVIPRMVEAGWGRAVHIASTTAVENHGPVTYCAAKAALAAYARSIGRIFAPNGLVISAVLPGVVVTEGGHWERAIKERPDQVERYIAERCPLGRFAQPSEIAPMIVLLCSELATYCQAAVVPIDGGQMRSYVA